MAVTWVRRLSLAVYQTSTLLTPLAGAFRKVTVPLAASTVYWPDATATPFCSTRSMDASCCSGRWKSNAVPSAENRTRRLAVSRLMFSSLVPPPVGLAAVTTRGIYPSTVLAVPVPSHTRYSWPLRMYSLLEKGRKVTALSVRDASAFFLPPSVSCHTLPSAAASIRRRPARSPLHRPRTGPVNFQMVFRPGRMRRWYWGVTRQFSISEASPSFSWVSPSRDSLTPRNR